MKRIRSEQISSTINHYLKRRQYTDGAESLKKERQAMQSVREMALAQAVNNQGSLHNTLSYSSVSGDTTVCDQQYTRVKTFIHEALEPYKTELFPLLYPLFIHMYLELLCNGQKTPAHKFYSRHHGVFKDRVDNQEVLDILQQMYNREDVLANAEIMQFREHRYQLSLSADAFQYLLRYLKTEECVLILQVLNKYIELRVGNSSMVPEQITEEEMIPSEQPSPAVTQASPEKKPAAPMEVSLASLKKVVSKVRESPPPAPSVCLYTILNTQGLCSVMLSAGEERLFAGFEDASIRVWSLTPNVIAPRHTRVNISRIHLATDHIDDINNKYSLEGGLGKETVAMKGHSGPVYSTDCCHDNKHLLSSSEDCTVRLWDLSTYTNIVSYRGHNYPVWKVAASPASTYFASCSRDKTVKLWCTDRIHPLRSFIGHLSDVNNVCFHSNGNYVATCSSDHTVRLWSIQDGQCVRLFQEHKLPVHALTFAPSGKYLASAGEDGVIAIWDLSAGRLLRTLQGHSSAVYTLAFNPDSSILASGGMDGMVRVWDVHHVINQATDKPQVLEGRGSGPELLAAFSAHDSILHHIRFNHHSLVHAVAGSSDTTS